MTLLELFLIGIGLSMDCFAVSLSFGTVQALRWKEVIKMAAWFGLFQGMMPVIGWIIGNTVQSHIASIDHWIAFGILGFIGLKMIIQSFTGGVKERSLDIRKTSVLLSLSIATSIDALITGISFGFIHVNILLAAVIITSVTFISSVIGARLGKGTSFLPARWAEFAGGIVLIGIGSKILFEHLSAI
jgi:putative Mn2+ efflux pump MntP